MTAKRKVLLLVAMMITSIYTLLVFFAVDGFARNGIFIIFLDYAQSLGTGLFFVMLITICVITNILISAFLIKRKRYNDVIAKGICSSFLIGCLAFIFCIKISVISKYLYSLYVLFFYGGNYYDGEEKIQQTLSFMVRLLPLCFLLGGGVSYLVLRLYKNKKSIY